MRRPARTSRAGTRPRPAGGRRRRRRTGSAATNPSSTSSRCDRLDGARDARIVGGEEPDERDHQRAGVEAGRAVVLREGVALGVEAPLEHLAVDVVASRAPAVDRTRRARTPRRAHRAVERHPRHHLRVHEVAAIAAHLPDALVGLAPARLEELEDGALQRPRVRVLLDARGSASGAASRAPRRRRRAGTGGARRCRRAPAPSPRSRAASRPRTRRGGARPRART